MAGITGGVDTHLDVHVAAALSELGGELGTRSFPTTPTGYRQLLSWLRSYGPVDQIGVEGTGSYGAGLARFLRSENVPVVEVDRPNRQKRRQQGKNDTLDAVRAGRAVLAGDATGAPKNRDGKVESIRVLRVAKTSANKARTQALNQLRSLVSTAPDGLREQLRHLTIRHLTDACVGLRPGSDPSFTAATKRALRSLARRVRALDEEIHDLDVAIAPLVTQTAPRLLERNGVGPDTASALLVAAGDNPSRLRNEASFARLCGAAPIPTGSGKTNDRHRLHRGGDRQANSALWRIVLTRMSNDPATRAYVQRRLKEGLSKREIMRCLKRFLAREIYQQLPLEQLT